jgi:hypothetical protein
MAGPPHGVVSLSLALAILTAAPATGAAPVLDATPPAATAARSRPASDAPSPREGALLLEARRALDTDPARALALVQAHRAEFPQSQLGPERAHIAGEARRRLTKGGRR